MMSTANRLLPEQTGDQNKHSWAGYESTSEWAPSFLTRLTDEASTRNNEHPG
jgi:hypothetical protein